MNIFHIFDSLLRLLEENSVTFSQMTPSLLKSLGNDIPHSVKHLLLGGEAFPDLQFPVRTNLKIYNIYGLTEMSVWQSLVNVLPINKQSITPAPICQEKNLLRHTEVKVCANGEIVVLSKVVFFCQCSKMQSISFKKFIIKTCFIQFLWVFRLKCWLKGQIISRIHLSLPNEYKLMCF